MKRYDFAARGWQGNKRFGLRHLGVDPDWYNLPSQPAYTKYDAAVYSPGSTKLLRCMPGPRFRFTASAIPRLDLNLSYRHLFFFAGLSQGSRNREAFGSLRLGP